MQLDSAALLARDDVDVIDVGTPQHLHPDLAVAAATAGKHVLCERPIAPVPADGAAMVPPCRTPAWWSTPSTRTRPYGAPTSSAASQGAGSGCWS